MTGKYMSDLNRRLGLCLVVAVLALAGCSSTKLNRAPVEDRLPGVGSAPAPVGSEGVQLKQPQGFENAGKPGYYAVRPGDTLRRIAIDNGQSAQDIARWSNVENPNRIEVGQVLRVVPPVETGVVVKPVSKSVLTDATAPAALAASAPASAAKPAAAEGVINWIWPANGVLLAGFDEVKNKGLDIAGAAGDAVLCALAPATTRRTALFEAIPQRQSTRGEFDSRPLSNLELRQLEAAGAGRGVSVRLLTAARDLERVLEFVVAGKELCPGYTEQNNPFEQRAALADQAVDDPEKLDEDFITALEHGMPPTGGLGIGIDRLVMMLTGTEVIRDVILFPQMKKGG